NFTYRYVPAVRRVQELIQEGFLGQPLFVNAQWFQQLYVDPDLPTVWRLDREEAGTGVLGDLGSHLVDLLSWWLGPLRRVAAGLQTYPPRRRRPGGGQGTAAVELDTTCSFLAELPDGLTATCQVSQTAACRANFQHVEIYGSEGCLIYELEWSGPDWMLGGLRGGRRDGLLEPMEIPARLTAELGPLPRAPITDFLPNRANCVRDFIDAIVGGASRPPDFVDGLRAQCAVDAVASAARRREWVEVPAIESPDRVSC
ncbi:MAG TPA: Gfo/Idh/MocA family oxidoreductase, partial [Gemmatimonadota bacterium]|nr:Gfo/Idh/MocA family oxidoreductase [Gemmatimonadota bacterium]